MSDSKLNQWLAEGDDAAEAGFTPDPPASPPDPVGAHVFVNTEDPTAPLVKHWDGVSFVQTATPVANVTGLAAGVATFLGTPSSANLRSALTDETGTGAAVFATSPSLVTPALGTPSAAVLTNATGLPTAGLVDDAVTNAKAANMAEETIKGRAVGAGTGDPTDLTPDQVSTILDEAADPFLRTSAAGSATLADGDYGDVTVSSSGTVFTIDNDVVTFAKMQNADALSVVGRSANSSGDLDEIAAASDHEVLRRSGTSIGFGAINLAQAAAVTGALPTANQASQAGRLIGIQTITATGAGTYTPTSGTVSIVLELVGGGGGGSGVAQAAASQVNLGGGGGGGAYLRKRLTANFSGAGYVVGAGGTGGTAGNNSGNDGTSSTFTDTAGSPTTYTAGGGGGGDPRTSFATPISITGSSFGGEPGTPTNGDLNVFGEAAKTGFATSVNIGWSSRGGNSLFGAGGVEVTAASAAGNTGAAGKDYGGGGSGAYSSNNAGGAKAGGDGGDGILIIWEYS